MKVFNTTAVCIPSKHYMVDPSAIVADIRKMVDAGKYFSINRARQYGKTTTLNALKQILENDYIVLSLSFEGITSAGFQSEGEFVQIFSRLILDLNEFHGVSIPDKTVSALEEYSSREPEKVKMDELFRTFRRWIVNEKKPFVLIVDEVDNAANDQVFLDFLGLLRDGYISREKDQMPAFWSVILAGVTDIKHLKSKIRKDDESKENSPWNIASDFTLDLSLPEDGIREMLDDYEADHHTGMDTGLIANKIRRYTNGYPFLVSRICQLISERLVPETFETLSDVWTDEGVETAIKILVTEKNTLFDSLMSKLENYKKLRDQLRRILLRGEIIEYLPDNREQEQLMMYGFIINDHNTVAVANRIFEMRLYKYYVGESKFADEMREDALDNKPAFIENGELNVPLIMERFIETQKYIRNLNDEKAEKRFIEEEGREKFLTYISPIINGIGTYSVEDRTRDRKRMDVVIHYRGRRYIIELKIWHGERYNAMGEEQIMDYLDSYGLDTGYLLSFSFNKTKEPGVEEVRIGGKLLYEGVV